MRAALTVAAAAFPLALALAAAAAPADLGQRIATQGAPRGAPACTSCHGQRGEGLETQNAPRLAGLDAGYIADQLGRFASGARKSEVMAPVASALAPADRAAVGGYFAALPAPSRPAAATKGDLARGRVLAERGDWTVKVPACGACHGERGLGVGAVTPPLVGQSQAYLAAQLQAFRSEARRSDSLGLMNGIAARLSAADLQAVAAYYASLPPGGAH